MDITLKSERGILEALALLSDSSSISKAVSTTDVAVFSDITGDWYVTTTLSWLPKM